MIYIEDLPSRPWGVIIFKGKQPYYDWSNSFDDDVFMKPSIDDGLTLMVSDDLGEEGAVRFVKKNYPQIFEELLFAMYTTEDRWPQNRTFKLFEEWVDWQYCSLVRDAR